MNIKNPELFQLCQTVAAPLDGLITHRDHPLTGGQLLYLISGLESDFGRLREFARLEAAYACGGSYYRRSAELQRMWQRWGAMAACSFGTFQIMFPTAVEVGYGGPPCGLMEDNVSSVWATQLIKARFIGRQGAKTLEEVLDAYNSGSCRDTIIPVYVRKGVLLAAELGYGEPG